MFGTSKAFPNRMNAANEDAVKATDTKSIAKKFVLVVEGGVRPGATVRLRAGRARVVGVEARGRRIEYQMCTEDGTVTEGTAVVQVAAPGFLQLLHRPSRVAGGEAGAALHYGCIRRQ